MLTIGLILVAILFALGSPVFVAFALGAIVIAIFGFGLTTEMIATLCFESVKSYTFLALPLFILMGDIFLRAGGAKPLIDLFSALFGRVRGSLGVGLVTGCGFFSALCGSANATIAAMGTMVVPSMLEMKYDRGITGGVLAAAGSLGNLIPPSVFFILYGALVEQNIATLFMAGLVPGIITTGLLAITFLFVAYRKGFPKAGGGGISMKIVWRATPAIVMPVIVLGGIYSGIFTPTEAAAVACVYSLLLGFVIYRQLNFRKLWEGTISSLRLICNIWLIVMGASLLSKMFGMAGWPQAVAALATEAGITPMLFLLLAAVVMVFLGIFVEAISMMYLVVPLFFPAAMAFGVSPIHFGVLVVLSMMVGQCTPPMASSIYVSAIVTKIPAYEIARGITPFTLAIIVALVVAIFLPELSLWLPKLMGMVVYY